MTAVDQTGMSSRPAVISCADVAMLPAACCALLSARQNLTDPQARYFLLAVDIDAVGKEQVKAFSDLYGFAIEVLDYVSPQFEGQHFGRWAPATVARLYLDRHVPADVSRLLYIDADTLVSTALDPLFATDMADHPAAAVDDYVMAFPAKMNARLSKIGMVTDSRYFNAGVLLLNWSRIMNGDNVIADARTLFAAQSKLFDCPDQDALNIVMQGRWLALDPRWNTQTGLLPVVETPGIVHFTGRKKPWHHRAQWPHRASKRYYTDALAESPWAGFCAPTSCAEVVRSFVAHRTLLASSRRKTAAVTRYFSRSQAVSPKGAFSSR